MKMLSVRDVAARTTLGVSTIYRLISLGRFPAGVKVSENRVCWPEEQITGWLKSRIEDGSAVAR